MKNVNERLIQIANALREATGYKFQSNMIEDDFDALKRLLQQQIFNVETVRRSRDETMEQMESLVARFEQVNEELRQTKHQNAQIQNALAHAKAGDESYFEFFECTIVKKHTRE